MTNFCRGTVNYRFLIGVTRGMPETSGFSAVGQWHDHSRSEMVESGSSDHPFPTVMQLMMKQHKRTEYGPAEPVVMASMSDAEEACCKWQRGVKDRMQCCKIYNVEDKLRV